jgi:hypothetical protein
MPDMHSFQKNILLRTELQYSFSAPEPSLPIIREETYVLDNQDNKTFKRFYI